MNVLRRLVKPPRPRWEDSLTYEQRMLFNQFKVRVFITIYIIIFSSITLYLDVGLARKYGIWLTNLLSFIIGWWMPSPGQQPQQTNQNLTEINRPFVAIQSGENEHS